MRRLWGHLWPDLSPKQWRVTLWALGPAVVLVAVGAANLLSGSVVTSSNAYLKAGKVQVSADVAGRIVEVPVTENTPVAKGTVLFQIDPAPYEIAVARAEADLVAARSTVLALKARYREMGAELESAKADSAFTEREFARQARLARTHVASDAKLDAADQARAKALQRISAIEEQRAAILAQLGGNPDAPVEENPTFKAAKAALDQAKLDLQHTTVRAPADGLVSQTDSCRPGRYVEPGESLFVLVETANIWVEANLKETEVTDIRAGQPAVVRIDAYPGREWMGHVASLSAGTGQEWAILPPQNASGNWVKVTQRVPVRIILERRADDPPLRIGMSAKIEIDTRPRSQGPNSTLVGDASAHY